MLFRDLGQLLGHGGRERDDVVLDFALDLLDAIDLEVRAAHADLEGSYAQLPLLERALRAAARPFERRARSMSFLR